MYEGRGWNKQGAHSGAVYNSESLGIAFIGNFNGAKPNDIALDAAKQLIYCGVHWVSYRTFIFLLLCCVLLLGSSTLLSYYRLAIY